MGSEWQKYALTDLYSVSSGLSKPAKDFGEGYPFVSFKDVFYNFFLPENLSQLVRSTDKEKEKCSVRRGDVFLTRTSETMEDLGMSCVARRDYPEATFNGFCKRLRPSTALPIHPEYIGYFLRTPQFRNEMLAFSTMSTRASLNNDMIGRLQITLPPLPEQKAIAHILGTLDDKIELNRRMNATLEGMAQALFKSWFVDFDPVIDNVLMKNMEAFCSKNLSSKQPSSPLLPKGEEPFDAGKSLALWERLGEGAFNGVPDELAPRAEVRRQALESNKPSLSAEASAKAGFPAAFQFTEELGWIPEGWKVGRISDLAALNPESWTAKKHPDSVNYVDLANTKDGRINETTAYEFGEAPSRARRVLKQHDAIIGTVRPGNRSFAYIHDDGLTGSTGFAVLRPNEVAYRSFIYLGLTRDEVIEVFAHLADGAAYPAIRPEVVGNTQIPIPSSAVLQLFEDQAGPMIAKTGQHQREAETLSELRDTLLPRLISGEVHVPDAEQFTTLQNS